MDKKDGLLFIAGGAIEFVGWGVGMITHIPEQVGYVIVVLGFIILVVAIFRFIRYKPIYQTWHEIQARGDAKRGYLDPLKENLGAITEKYKGLFNEAVEKNVKYLDSISEQGIIKAAGKLGQFLLNNPYYSDLKKSRIMDKLRNNYEAIHSHIRDKRLKKCLIKLWKCEHQAKSVLIFYETLRARFGDIPERVTRMHVREETPLKEYQDALNKVYERIDELLGGVPDEL
ncbi:hypothetical protein ACFLU4_01055 [Chloroflexota bacterium]